MVLALAFAIGIVAGLRSFTAPALVCWAGFLGWVPLSNTKVAFLGTMVAIYISTGLALVELVLDKQSWIGARTKPGPLIDRLIMGGLSGFALGAWPGAVAGAIGALAGTFGGYKLRHGIVAKGKLPDMAVALIEDAIAIGGGLLVVSRFSAS